MLLGCRPPNKWLSRSPPAGAHRLQRLTSSSMARALCTTKLPRRELLLGSRGQVEHPFRVLTFNMLADGLAQNGDFVRVPPEVLSWAYRRPLLLEELRESQADILCLQELNHYDAVAAALQPLHYQGFFLPKSSSPCLKYQCPPDGTAVFWRTTRFQLLQEPYGAQYITDTGQAAGQGFISLLLQDLQAGQQLLVASTHLKAKSGEANEQTRKRQVLQLLHHLEALSQQGLPSGNGAPSYQSAGGNGSSSNGGASLSAAAAAGDAGNRSSLPVVLCGDFNTTPNSATCQAVRDSDLGLVSIWDVLRTPEAAPAAAGDEPPSSEAAAAAAAVQQVQPAGGAEGPSEPIPQPGEVQAAAAAAADAKQQQGLQQQRAQELQQAYQAQQQQQSQQGLGSYGPESTAQSSIDFEWEQPGRSSQDGSPRDSEYSTWKFRSQGEVMRVIDYIWFSSQQLQAVSKWEALDRGAVGSQGLPCVGYASDHLAVLATLGWTSSSQ